MIFLIDESTDSSRLAAFLTEAGYETVSAKALMPSVRDEVIFEYACAHNYMIITKDKDFGKIALDRGPPYPCIIRLIEDQPIAEVLDSLRQVFDHQLDALTANALLVIAKDHFRLRITWDKRSDPPPR